VQIASIQHAAIHFPQTDVGRLAIVSPFYAADVPPGWNLAKDRAELIESLPGLYAARWQAALFRLSNIRWRCLTTLPDRFGTRHDAPALAPHVQALKRELTDAGLAIEARNERLKEAGLPRYRYLLPELAPCSINA